MKVVAPNGLAYPGIKILRDNGFSVHAKSLTKKELLRILPKYDVLIVKSKTTVKERTIRRGKNLKAICRAGVGTDNIDVEFAAERGIPVFYAPMGNTRTTAEHAMALTFAIARRIPQSFVRLKEGDWCKSDYQSGTLLQNKTMGIIGCGRIGGELAYLAKAIGMNVVGYDPYPINIPIINQVSMDQLLKLSDFISIHSPKGDEPILGKSEFWKMRGRKPYIVNASRGGNVDEAALVNAIQKNYVTAAALDVFEGEGDNFNNKIFTVDDLIGTPHLGASTTEARVDTSIEIANSIVDYLRYGEWIFSANMTEAKQEKQQFFNLFIHHDNTSGVFGDIGSILHADGINIRKHPSSLFQEQDTAMTIYMLYGQPSQEAIQHIQDLKPVHSIKF